MLPFARLAGLGTGRYPARRAAQRRRPARWSALRGTFGDFPEDLVKVHRLAKRHQAFVQPPFALERANVFELTFHRAQERLVLLAKPPEIRSQRGPSLSLRT